MAGYRFFPSADLRQDEIWDYTCEQWGEAQAKKYIQGLHCHVQNLAEGRIPWRPLAGSLVVPSDLSTDVFFSHYGRHYVFFRELSVGLIGVMSILHDSMDIPVRLSGDLKILSSNEQK